MGLHWIDVVVVFALMGAVTWLGHGLSGNIEDRRGFFEAQGSLPWWAVSASIIATLVSSVTFISVPAAVFRDGGNLTYFQVILGLAAGKFFISGLLAKPYYLSRGISTTYDYISARMDRGTGEWSMGVGLVLSVINSGVKLPTASLVLDVITGWGLPMCSLVIVLFSLLWSAMAGIKTVIWTDFLLFVLFAAGAVFALVFALAQVEMPLAEGLRFLDDQAKLVLFDFSTDPTVRYTIWSGVFGAIGLSIALGSTQGTWQRVRSCRSVGDAYRAYNYSAAFYLMHLFILGVGLALVLFYTENPLPASVQDQLATSPDRIFPHFIVSEIPPGISGLFIAAIFAAAISTIDSSLTENSDITVRHIYEQWINRDATEAHYLMVSRVAVLIWAFVFWGVSIFFSRYSAEGLLDLTFKLPNYLYGAIFGTIVLARFGIGRMATWVVGFAAACAIVAWLASNDVAFFLWCPISGMAMVGIVWMLERTPPEMSGIVEVNVESLDEQRRTE